MGASGADEELAVKVSFKDFGKEKTRRREERIRKRERARIFYDVLNAIVSQENMDGAARITPVQNEVNLPSDRLRIHLREMSRLRLIDYGKTLSSTKKGRHFLVEYRRIIATLEQFGLL